MSGFLDALRQRVLVCDGAMGTMLYARGVFLNRSFDELNLTEPDLVRDIHREYVDAGADVVETNTFGANAFKLVPFGLAEELARINREGARLARQAAAGRAWVAGAMGPLGVRIAPWGRTSEAEASTAFQEQARALVEGGVDLILLETFGDLGELVAAIRAIRATTALPIVAQLTTGEDGHTVDGTPPETFMPELERAGADVIGVNCSVGPAAMLETIEAMARVSDAPLAAQPNAGRPREIDGRHLYLSSPEYMASYARRFAAAGVRLVGGCCGTTPAHTREIAQAVRAAAPHARPAKSARGSTPAEPPPRVVARADKSGVARAFADARFVTIADVLPARGFDPAPVAAAAGRLRDAGATAIAVPDYPRSGARPRAAAVAELLEQRRIETLLHVTCRDRTLVGLQSDLVGAHVLGVRNVLATTGTPARVGSYQDASSTFEVDSVGLIKLLARLNEGLDIAGQPAGAPAGFHIGAAVNPFAVDPDTEWRRLALKMAAGAEFLVTPPIFDIQAFDEILPRLRDTGVPIVAGVAALEHARHAEFLANEVIGVRMPDAVLRILEAAADPAAEARRVVADIIAALAERVQGISMTSFRGSPETAARLVAEMGTPARG